MFKDRGIGVTTICRSACSSVFFAAIGAGMAVAGCSTQEPPQSTTTPTPELTASNEALSSTPVTIVAAYGSSIEGTGTDCSVAGTGCSAYSAYKVFDNDPQLQTRWASAWA